MHQNIESEKEYISGTHTDLLLDRSTFLVASRDATRLTSKVRLKADGLRTTEGTGARVLVLRTKYSRFHATVFQAEIAARMVVW